MTTKLNGFQMNLTINLSSVLLLLIALLVGPGTPAPVRGMETVIGIYGETTVLPCDDSTPAWDKRVLTMWRYVQGDGTTTLVLTKRFDKATHHVELQAPTGSHEAAQQQHRVSIDDRSGLVIERSELADRGVYTCVAVSQYDVRVRSVSAEVYTTVQPEIAGEAERLEKDRLVPLGTCVVRGAHPAAQITWQRNGLPLTADGERVVVVSGVTVDPGTGLSTTSSSLRYAAAREDAGARFNCRSDHKLGPVESDETLTFPVLYPTERLSLTVVPEGPVVAEGDTVTLACHADGNPAPTGYNFHLAGGRTVLVENSNTYALPAVTRDAAGEYKCSLVGDGKMEASRHVAVSYLDLSLSPTGKVLKTVGDPLAVEMEMDASAGDARVSWTKDGEKTEGAPLFGKLTYAHAGLYACEVSSGGLTRRRSFELVVEGAPVIAGLHSSPENGGLWGLVCEARGVPEPRFTWSVNGTDEATVSYDEKTGAATSLLYVAQTVDTAELTSVTCSVSNRLGEDARTVPVPWASEVSIWSLVALGLVLSAVAIVVVGGAIYAVIRRFCCTPEERNNNLPTV